MATDPCVLRFRAISPDGSESEMPLKEGVEQAGPEGLVGNTGTEEDWREIDRTLEQVDAGNGFLVNRITQVKFERRDNVEPGESGRTMTLTFAEKID